MSMCIEIIFLNRPCRNKCNDGSGFCFTHTKNYCSICNESVKSSEVIKLDCAHIFCKKCISKDICDNQWFDGFSTDDPLICPLCKLKVNDKDWSVMMEICFDLQLFIKRVEYGIYFNKKQLNDLNHINCLNYLESNKSLVIFSVNRLYNKLPQPFNQDNKNLFVDKVLFIKRISQPYNSYSTVENRHYHIESFYYFKIDYSQLRIDNESFHKELCEYIYHPSRINFNEID